MKLIKAIGGAISPKSVVHSGHGLFFAQNMMYRHTVTAYDRKFRHIGTVPDAVYLPDFGFRRFSGIHRGAPVEAAFTPDGRYAWVSNYQMYGKGFSNPGNDGVCEAGRFDHSFLYRIDTGKLKVDTVVAVGSVPKYVAVTPDGRTVLASNWCSGDLSIVDAERAVVVGTVPLGRFPRGIAIDGAHGKAYVAVMGSCDIAVVRLDDRQVGWLRGVGCNPRHLCLDPAGEFLYATLNGEGNVVKIERASGRVVGKVATGRAPRSMVLSGDGAYLYVVNYESGTVGKVRTADLRLVETVRTGHHPIGITYDGKTDCIWVACYSGSIRVFQA